MSAFIDSMYGIWEDPKPKKAHEIAKEWRRQFFEIDNNLNKAQRAVEMHPEKYVMGFTIQPHAIYERELARAKYEMGLELAKLLKSEPEPLKPIEKNKGNRVVFRTYDQAAPEEPKP